jgi:hypothetical protein
MRIVLAIAMIASGSMLVAGDLTGKAEVVGEGGGVTFTQGGGSHGTFGGSVGYGFPCLIGKPELCKRTIIIGEFDFTPVGSGGGASEKFMDFFGGAKIAIIPSDKAEPYIIAGFGGSIDRVSQPPFPTFNQKAYGLHVGVGDRLFVGKNWGIVPEIRWEHYFHHGQDGNAFRYTGGIFYQWGK